MLLPIRKRASLPDGHRPVLVVVVDTEEEFQWDKPFDRANIDTRSVASQPRMHERVFDRFGIVPTYMIDWPVATAPAAVATLRALRESGLCHIGTQLHPWVSPPYEEPVTVYNSFVGNLSPMLERAKLSALTHAITDGFGQPPVVYKAGRYGIGPYTAEILGELGYQMDASVVPYTSFAREGGPDFTSFDEHPFWFPAGGRELLELPVTTGYCGLLRDHGPGLYGFAQSGLASKARLGGILARTRMLERIRLSPEGATASDLMRVSRDLVASGCQIFSLTYHSPSLVPGHTPYVRTERDLEQFITSIRDYCTFFRDELGGVFMNMSQLYMQLLETRESEQGVTRAVAHR